MSEPVTQPDLEALRRSIRLLEQRVTRLERRTAGEEPDSGIPDSTGMPEASAAAARQDAFGDTANAIPILGKSLLGLAGAYLLRAATESGSVPMNAGVGIGILYALGWLSFAARGSADRRLESVMYSLTAVLILAPMLWESVLRFHAVTTPAAALALLAFTTAGLMISWRRNLTDVAWISTLSGLFTGAALLLATHDLIPFTFAILGIAVAVECSACFDHWLRERWLVAFVADLAVLLLTWISTLPNGLPESYSPIAPSSVIGAQLLLLGIYLASSMTRTLWRGLPFTSLELFQCVIAFLLAILGGLRVSGPGTAMANLLAGITLVFGIASYLVSLAFLERRGRRERNFYSYSTFGLLLAVAGGSILAPPATLGALLPAVALAFFLAGIRWKRLTLIWHGTFYLLLGAALSGAAAYTVPLLLAQATGLTELTRSAWIASAGVLIACLLLHYRASGGESAWERAPLFLVSFAATLIWTGIAAGAATGAVPAAAGNIDPAFFSTVRTAMLLAAVLTLAWASRRWNRAELAWLVYPLLAAAGYKFLAQDFRHQHTMALFLSLALWGAAMLVLPRFVQRR